MGIEAIIGISAGVALGLFLLFVTSYKKAPPDTAYFVSGFGKKKVKIGGACFCIPFLQRLDKVPLNIIQIDIKTKQAVPTKEFININVDGVANVKISADKDKLELAAQIFLKEKLDGINKIVQQVLDGNMREIIGQMEIRDLVHNRDEFAAKVRQSASKDMEKMGIEIINFTVQNFSDNDSVLTNLGIDHVVSIQKSAQISRAQSERDVAVERSKAQEEANRARVAAEEKIAVQNNTLAVKQAELKREEDTKRAIADTSYEIAKQQRMAEVNTATAKAQIATEEQRIELSNKRVEVTKKELDANIRAKADADKYAQEQKAAADKIERERAAEANLIEAQKKAEADKAKAEAHKITELAKAAGIEAVGRAEAEAISKRADALKKLEDAGKLELILNSGVIPQVVTAQTKPIAEAMAKINSITMYGEGNQAKLTSDLMQVIDKISAGTGIDFKNILAGFAGGLVAGKAKNEAKQDGKGAAKEVQYDSREVKSEHKQEHKAESKKDEKK